MAPFLFLLIAALQGTKDPMWLPISVKRNGAAGGRRGPKVLAHARRLFAIWMVVGCWCVTGSQTSAQPPVHYRHNVGSMAPGEIARRQLSRGGPLQGYFQPVEVKVPDGASISLAQDGKFLPGQPGHVKAGMLIGPVYRLKVTGIPLNEGHEVYPTIEVINRLYPPPGLAVKFPIPIQLSKEELIYALSGKYVTRVIYLEDPRRALPVRNNPELQRVFEVGREDDPLKIADNLGRPMAILRMGSRVPDFDAPSNRFTFGMPPFLDYTNAAQPPARNEGIEEPSVIVPQNDMGSAILRTNRIPRLPVRTGRYPVYPAHYR